MREVEVERDEGSGAVPTGVVDEEAFDRLFAGSAGPWLRLYVTLRLRERGGAPPLDAVLEDLWVGLLATEALVHAGDRASLSSRLYGLVDAALPHLGRPGLRRADDPALRARGRRFVSLVAGAWHGGFDDALAALLALDPLEREALLLRDHHAMPMHELAARLGLPRDAARALVDAARAKVRTLQQAWSTLERHQR